MTFDILAALSQPCSAVTVHNVRLIDVKPSESGYELLTIDHGGTTYNLVGGNLWRLDFSARNIGKFGYIVPPHPSDQKLPAGACYFREYIDQSLRRVPELDSSGQVTGNDGRLMPVIGWICDALPQGFRAPVGIIPGEGGHFIPDNTVSVTLRVPPEFVRECRRVQMTPREVLQSFVGDLAGIQNYVALPRADGYGSNGSDERMYAETWLDRAHGMNAIDLYALEARQEENREKQIQREDFSMLLDDFEDYGGKADELIAIVQAIVDKQAGSNGS